MKKPYVYATISIFAWSTMPVVTKLLLNSYSNFQALWPIMCVVFACIVLKDKFSIRKGCAIALSFLGVAVVMGEEILHLNKSVLFGAFFCAMGAVSYGIFTAYYKKYKFNKGVSMMLNYFATFVITSVILCFNREFFCPRFLILQGLRGTELSQWLLPTRCG